MTDYDISIPQGWQCPICKRVYSPNTCMCMYCGGEQKTFVTTDISTSTDTTLKFIDKALKEVGNETN